MARRPRRRPASPTEASRGSSSPPAGDMHPDSTVLRGGVGTCLSGCLATALLWIAPLANGAPEVSRVETTGVPVAAAGAAGELQIRMPNVRHAGLRFRPSAPDPAASKDGSARREPETQRRKPVAGIR